MQRSTPMALSVSWSTVDGVDDALLSDPEPLVRDQEASLAAPIWVVREASAEPSVLLGTLLRASGKSSG